MIVNKICLKAFDIFGIEMKEIYVISSPLFIILLLSIITIICIIQHFIIEYKYIMKFTKKIKK